MTIRQVRMVELPVGATEDRMLGTIDVEAALQDGTYRFEPGYWRRRTVASSMSMR